MDAIKKAASVLGKKGHREMLKKTSLEQREKWIKLGGESTRKYWENVHLSKEGKRAIRRRKGRV